MTLETQVQGSRLGIPLGPDFDFFQALITQLRKLCV